MTRMRGLREFVGGTSPRYWGMASVPALLPDLAKRMVGDGFVDADLRVKIPKTRVLDASLFGTPQGRRRLFSGRLPVPEPVPEGGASGLVWVLLCEDRPTESLDSRRAPEW